MMKNKIRICFYSFILFILLFALYFRANSQSIYAKIGDFYSKRANDQKAQIYYDKSYLLGNNNPKFRETYVKSIINSPLTIRSQERLVEIIQDDNSDSAEATAEYFLYNLKREIHNKYPLNYIKQAPYNQKILHWGKLPITYTFRHANGVPKEFTEEVNNAFDEWERASSCRVKFQQVKAGADIVVDFIKGQQKDDKDFDQKYVIAFTTPIVSQNYLKEMNIKFSINHPDGKPFTRNQIYNTALHEIFHALGFMGHSFDENNIMCMSKDSTFLEKDERLVLNDADKTTLELLYKIKPDITNADELSYDYVPYLILGDEEEVNYTKIREAKNYIRKAPALSGGYIDLAETLVAEKKYSEAIKNLEKALRLARNDETRYVVYYNLAVSHYYIGNYPMALDYADYAKSIKDSEELHFLLAEIYVKQKNEEQAIKEYNYLIEQYPENIEYVVNLANIYVKKYSYLKARAVIKDFIKRNPKAKNNERLSVYGILKL